MLYLCAILFLNLTFGADSIICPVIDGKVYCSVKELNGGLLYFGLEKVTPENQNSWQAYCDACAWGGKILSYASKMDGNVPRFLAGSEAVKDCRVDSRGEFESYMVYATTKEVKGFFEWPPFGDSIDDYVSSLQLVMIVGLRYWPERIYYENRGIFRDPVSKYLRTFKNISTLLHAFSAVAILQIDPKLKYLAVHPARYMNTILLSSFQRGELFAEIRTEKYPFWEFACHDLKHGLIRQLPRGILNFLLKQFKFPSKVCRLNGQVIMKSTFYAWWYSGTPVTMIPNNKIESRYDGYGSSGDSFALIKIVALSEKFYGQTKSSGCCKRRSKRKGD